jgi:hypothetical protein
MVLRDESKNYYWADAPHMFVESVWEGRQSKGLLYLAEAEHARRVKREIDLRAWQQGIALLTRVVH